MYTLKIFDVTYLFHRHASAEYGGHCEVPSMARVARRHHVLGVEHLLREFWYRESSVLLRSAGGERCESRHEEVQPRERNHVDGELPQIRVQLTREAQTRRHSGHGQRDQVVEVFVRRIGQLERAEADVVQGFVVNAVRLVGVLDELVHRQRRVVRLDDGVRHLGRRHHRVRVHDAVRVLLADLGDEQRAHAGAGAASQRMRQLEPLETVAVLTLLADHVQHRVHQLGALRVVALGPVVSSSTLPEYEVVGPEKLAVDAAADRVHRSRLQVQQDGSRDVLTASSSSRH